MQSLIPEGKPPKLAILGFADSRVEAPFADDSWTILGVNDVYAYVPRVDISFELHHLQNLGNRRNPKYLKHLQEGKHPVYFWEELAEYPSSRAFPRTEVMREFGSYFTNSISWMIALAAFELTEPVEVNGQVLRLAKPGAQIGIWGVDMAADTEYGSQRPSCEYHVGVAVGMGVPVYVPATSDLCKATSLYGIETTAPLRIKGQAKIQSAKQSIKELQQQMAMSQQQQAEIAAKINHLNGVVETWKYVNYAWTYPTDIPIGAEAEAKDRGVPMLPLESNGHTQTDNAVELVKGGESHR